jgi:hypothetical protein
MPNLNLGDDLLSAMSLQNLPEIADYYLIINGELVWEISD